MHCITKWKDACLFSFESSSTVTFVRWLSLTIPAPIPSVHSSVHLKMNSYPKNFSGLLQDPWIYNVQPCYPMIASCDCYSYVIREHQPFSTPCASVGRALSYPQLSLSASEIFRDLWSAILSCSHATLCKWLHRHVIIRDVTFICPGCVLVERLVPFSLSSKNQCLWFLHFSFKAFVLVQGENC